jgi:protein-S-isoprenylcysteine O-methyltransferase Ste14
MLDPVGRILFRFRSFTPVPVIAVLLALLWASPGPGPGGWAVSTALIPIGIGIAILGQALRFYTLGQVSDGTSGQGSTLEASSLNMRGPYAFVRNPLYLGNLGICAGLILLAHRPWIYAIGFGFFFLEYFFIIRAEEHFLRAKYGSLYEGYASRVRRWVPRLTPAYEGQLRRHFDFARALKKEHNPFAAWVSGLLLLLGWRWHQLNTLSDARLAILVSLEAVVLAIFAMVKAYKRGWLRAY